MSVEINTTSIVYYHNNCVDGFTSAYIVYKLHPEWEFKGCTYGQYLPTKEELTGKDIYLLDFSFPVELFEVALEVSNSVTLIDHHESAVNKLSKFFNHSKVTTHISMDKSGAMLTWEYFNPITPAPLFVQYVQDRDIWTFKLPSSKFISEYIISKQYTFENWEVLFNTKIDKMIEIGEALYNTKIKNIVEFISNDKNKHVLNIGGYEFTAYNLPYFWSSDGANLIAQRDSKNPFGACFYHQSDGYVFSLRSIGDFNVAKIAEQYGGGGHKNAAGFKVLALDQFRK